MSDNAVRKYSADYERALAYYRSQTDPDRLRPRVKMALRLYVHAAVPTKEAAARAVGLNPKYLELMSNTEAGKAYMKSAHDILNDTAVQTNVLIEKLSRRAIEVIGTTMEDASSEALRLKAAIDLADRGPETSKIHKHQVESFTLSGEDAKAIAESMVAAASVRQANARLVKDNYDKVTLDDADDTTPVVAGPLKLLEP